MKSFSSVFLGYYFFCFLFFVERFCRYLQVARQIERRQSRRETQIQETNNTEGKWDQSCFSFLLQKLKQGWVNATSCSSMRHRSVAICWIAWPPRSISISQLQNPSDSSRFYKKKVLLKTWISCEENFRRSLFFCFFFPLKNFHAYILPYLSLSIWMYTCRCISTYLFVLFFFASPSPLALFGGLATLTGLLILILVSV